MFIIWENIPISTSFYNKFFISKNLSNQSFKLLRKFTKYSTNLLKKEEEERRRKAEEMVAEANNANVIASTASTTASLEPQLRPPSANTATSDIFSFEAKNETNEANSNGESSNNENNEIGKILFICFT